MVRPMDQERQQPIILFPLKLRAYIISYKIGCGKSNRTTISPLNIPYTFSDLYDGSTRRIISAAAAGNGNDG